MYFAGAANKTQTAVQYDNG